MAYSLNGVPLSDLFDQPVGGQSVTINGMRAGGTPLTFAPVSIGAQRANVGYRVAGVDIATLCAAKGTAQVVSDGGLPLSLSRFVITSAPGAISSIVSFTFGRNGEITWASGGAPPYAGTWAPGGGTVGDAYDVDFALNSSSGAGTMAGVGLGWQQVNTNRTASLTATLPPSGQATIEGTRVIQIRVRQRSSGVVLVNRAITLTANAERLL